MAFIKDSQLTYHQKFMFLRNSMIRNVEKPSFVLVTYLSSKNSYWERNFMNVKSVEKPFICALNIYHQREFTLVKDPMNVMNVGRLLLWLATYLPSKSSCW